ncbi:DNA-binding storekeeper protein-related transcriptional regulator [Artemisia annua]|uniref:DNA-binding storekeeper protein-related transcriptional regulator n=1 Tax=Artemisia annua TaxID=35608 RepID=A0A2U1KU52_ARTAN|nr:DNA-binding storekeeper protein-related transcriptional regulator [Artemisia annua]
MLIWGTSASSIPNGVDDYEVLMMDVEKSMDVNRFVKYVGSNYGPVLVEEMVKAWDGVGWISSKGTEGLTFPKKGEQGSKRNTKFEKAFDWKFITRKTYELYAKRTDLVQEHVAAVIGAVKSSAI